VTRRFDPLSHPLYLAPRRSLDAQPFEPPPKQRAETIDAPRRPVRARTFRLDHLRLELDVDVRKKRLSGRATLDLRPIEDGLASIELDASELTIRRVTVRGRRTAVRHDGETLTVALPRGTRAGARVRVAVDYAGRPRRGLWFVGPDRAHPERLPQAWSQCQAEDAHAWFPCVDHPNDKFTSEVVVTVDRDLTTVSNGKLVGKTTRGARTTWHWRQDRPHPAYLMCLTVAPYRETRGRASGVPLRYYAFPGKEKEARKLYGRTPAMMRTFVKLFGPYPWREYSQLVASEYTWGGMENTGATTLTEKGLMDARAAMDLTYDGLLAHELAHQWWGDLVTCHGWHHNWLNEGWATFCEALFNEARGGDDAGAWTRLKNANAYWVQDRGQYRRPIVFDHYHVPTDLFDRHAYEKASLVLQMLRDELGDATFFRASRRYLERFAHGFADTGEFRRVMEEESGKDLTTFFRQWLYEAGYPEIEASWRAARGGGVELVLHQRQSTRAAGHETTPLFDVLLEVDVVGTRGATRQRVRIAKANQVVPLACAGRPIRVAIDPRFRVLAETRLAQPPGAWRHALSHDRAFIERMRAARALVLGRRVKPADVRALHAALERDPHPQVRMAAAIALGEARLGRAAVRPLARAARSDRDSHVRRAAAFALGLAGKPAERALLELVARERSYLAKGTGLKALAHLKSSRLLEVCRDAMSDRGWRDVVPMAALDALAIARPPAAFDLAYAAVRYGEMQEVREAGVRLLVALAKDPKAKKARPEQARHVGPTLTALLEDPSVFARLAAIDGLCRLGDKKNLPAIRRSRREESWDHLQRTADRAIAQLTKGRRKKRKR
jgi:aminopeptidase N